MKIRSAWFRVSLLAVASAGVAFAAGGHAEHAAHAAPGIATLFFPVVNFAIFAYVVARYAWPALRGGLAERKKVVEKELAEGDRARKEAQAMLAEIEARRAGLAAEGERLIREMRAEAEHERDALVTAARQTADRIRADAKLLGDQEAERTSRTIREEVAAKVVARVATVLRERVRPEDEARFVDEFVATVEQTAGRVQ